mmetsp:Transcript_17434/g.44343  ORF Transcript_17434/g.44343 Transcript_17434/m.44343 type:complete len:317 (-) Transcript_17434:832-1782(-)
MPFVVEHLQRRRTRVPPDHIARVPHPGNKIAVGNDGALIQADPGKVGDAAAAGVLVDGLRGLGGPVHIRHSIPHRPDRAGEPIPENPGRGNVRKHAVLDEHWSGQGLEVQAVLVPVGDGDPDEAVALGRGESGLVLHLDDGGDRGLAHEVQLHPVQVQLPEPRGRQVRQIKHLDVASVEMMVRVVVVDRINRSELEIPRLQDGNGPELDIIRRVIRHRDLPGPVPALEPRSERDLEAPVRGRVADCVDGHALEVVHVVGVEIRRGDHHGVPGLPPGDVHDAGRGAPGLDGRLDAGPGGHGGAVHAHLAQDGQDLAV